MPVKQKNRTVNRRIAERRKMKEYIFTVSGMSCEMCESHINDAVRMSSDIKYVKSDRKKNTVTVRAESLDTDLIIRKITALGYKVENVCERGYEKKSLFSRLKR